MQPQQIRLRFRRRLRKSRRKVGDLGTQAEEQIDEHLLNRFERLFEVRRFVMGWIALVLLICTALVAQNVQLGNYYQSLRYVPGGIYNEGVLGRFSNANPIFATTDIDSAISRLVFAGLFKYDTKGSLVGDLAKDISVDAHGNSYTVHLKSGLKWQDGRPVTSDDVVFTYKSIQNPDVQSPFQNSWQGIDISAPDQRTIVFKLPGILASFPHSLTNGLLPKHLLFTIPPTELRSADFNTVHPIGAGPFRWQAIQVSGDGNPDHAYERIALSPFEGYQAGPPKLQKFVVGAYSDKTQLIRAFDSNQLNGIEGLTDLPAKLKDNRITTHSLPLNAANMVFFKTSSGVLSDQAVRKALVQSADVPSITSKLDFKARLVKEPILIGQLGYDKTLAQPGHDTVVANKGLDAAGWLRDNKNNRLKQGKPLSFSLTVADTHEFKTVSEQLKKQWAGAGIKMIPIYLNSADFQNALANHSYDAILYGISIGSDPDVFVYWDSSQADIRSANRLNLSEYKNPTADAALEAGRTRLDPELRTLKFKPFLQSWQADSPALGLYQPRVLYLTNGQVSGLSEGPINNPTDRFSNVVNWQIRQAKVTN